MHNLTKAFILLVLAPILLTTTTTSAHGSEAHEDKKNQSSYVFKTPVGGSLSLAARRAIQLYDQSKDDVSLSPAQASYIEANIVEHLGGRYLEINEEVTIFVADIENFAEKSKALDAASIAVWQTYAAASDFSLNDLTPVTSPEVKKAEDNNNENTEAKDTENESSKSAESDANALKSRNQNYLLLALTLAVLAFITSRVIRGRNQQEAPVEENVAEKPVKKTTTKTKKTASKSKK